MACTVQVSRGLSLVAAGSLVASNDAIAMVLLPPLCLLSRLCGLKPLLVGASANHTQQLIACGLQANDAASSRSWWAPAPITLSS